MTRVKICGLSREEDIEYANILLPDYIGFVFADASPRRVSPERAANLHAGLDGRVAAVGVFVDAPPEFVAGLLSGGVIDIAQLHGAEDARYISELKGLSGAPVIKALPARADRREYAAADFLLFDAFAPGEQGGSGKRFDWSEIGDAGAPFFLAGGLTPENAADAIAAAAPYCLDVSSGVETDGRKDFEKMKKFIEAVKHL
ncbi:MAG: phosphoribosylanthranilate isomerase [Oscillospiraceae bacterium]|jgi:phosphoribosylanthranilate isomerase|nr:phosphoribosylanthranilate isomerase [Oscillospiraceae bacterium]